jgi:hypothetical protein
MPEPLTRAELDPIAAAGCQMPGCTHEHHAGLPLYLHCRHHPGGKIEVSYDPTTGTLRIGCTSPHPPGNDGTIARISVKEKP